MRRPLLLGIGAAGALVVLAVAAGYAYYFSGLRSAPRALTLTTPSPTAAAASPASSAGLAGTWTVAQGSVAGYRVSEQFAGQASTHEAVARTSSVNGGLTVQQGPSGLQATAIRIAAQLAELRSVDTVAGRDVSLRDNIVSQSLSVFQYPTATFQAQSADVPAGLDTGQTVTLTIPGELTIHGVTKQVQVGVQLRESGGQVQAAGSTTFAMTDFGVQPPRVPITTVDPQVTLEFQLVLKKS